MGGSIVRRTCRVDGCHRLTRLKGAYRGRPLYGTTCVLHYKTKNGVPTDKELFMFGHRLIPNDKCIRCGWSEGPCDRHRIDPSKGYVVSNVMVLCPNCHRLEEMKKRSKCGVVPE